MGISSAVSVARSGWFRRTRFSASSTTVRVFNPRKSNLTSPAVSASSLENCETSRSDLSSL